MTGTPITRHYALPFDIHITLSDGRTGLSSRLHEQLVDDAAESADSGMVAVHALEALLLAMAHRGVNLGTVEVSLAVVDAVDALAQNLGSS
ncbi:MAG: hypothetical protein U1F53_20735 [Burkholderiaceae bacterium]